MFDATGQTAVEGLVGRSARDVLSLQMPRDNYHLRVHVSASILCEINEGSAWTYDCMDKRGRTMWKAAAGRGGCNVDPESKVIVRG